MYNVGAVDMARAMGVALVGGIAMGVLWGTIGVWFSFGIFVILVGIALGYAFTRMMDLATRGKRGPAIVALAIGGILIAWGMQFLFVPAELARFELLAVGVGAYFAYQNLR